jgi:hypothetical protein
VWDSLYNDRAWAERDWYQVPQDAAGLAVLVTLGFPDEAANGVIFTGDPADPTDLRYLVNAQVTWIYRVRSSSLATPGVPVLSDGQLTELGGVLAAIDAVFPLDLGGGHPRSDVLLDAEFKIEKVTGRLKLKQRIQGPASPVKSPSGRYESCADRNPRSGWGIRIRARPSADVKPVSPPSEPLGFRG